MASRGRMRSGSRWRSGDTRKATVGGGTGRGGVARGGSARGVGGDGEGNGGRGHGKGRSCPAEGRLTLSCHPPPPGPMGKLIKFIFFVAVVTALADRKSVV